MGATSPMEIIQTLGRYSLIEKLGEGFLGSVYRGIDQDLGRAVVVRILCDGIKWDAKVAELFYRECQSVAALQHPNIAAIFETGEDGQSTYIVMESLGSNTLEGLIAQKPPMPVEAKLSIMIQVAEGLSHAHKNGILHRDLGPGKIHLSPDGGVKIRDFAITHVLMKHLPHPIVRYGTPIYLSPEQIQHKDCDERSDIFSAGIIFYELLTYLHPFHDPNGNKALDNILSDVQIPTFEQFPDVPPGIWAILKTCLAKDPDDRYRSVDELLSAFKDLLKSLAEDTQLMLAELYASRTPLAKAAAQPDAPEAIINLLQNIEDLSRGAKEADYISLDGLMTALIEQYPVIQAAAAIPEPLGSQERATIAATKLEPLPSERELEDKDFSDQEQPTEAVVPMHLPDELPAGSAGMGQTLSTGSAVLEENLPEANPATAADTHAEMQPSLTVPPPEEGAGKPDERGGDSAPQMNPAMESPAVGTKPIPIHKTTPARRKPRIRKPSYRSVTVLLSVLVLAAAGYIVFGTEVAAPIRNAWNVFLTNSQTKLNGLIRPPKRGLDRNVSNGSETDGTQQAANQEAAALLKEARDLAAGNRLVESETFIRRVLAINPDDQAAIVALREVEERLASNQKAASGKLPQELFARISALIDSGKLQPAKMELDKLQQMRPEAPEVLVLRKRWQAKSLKETQEQAHKEEEQQKAAQQKDDEWNRQLADLFARGKYAEARSALDLWLAEYPGSSRAQEFLAKDEEIQRSLKAYASAMYEGRYQDALSALRAAEKYSPSDPTFEELHRQIETRRAAARALLTVYRLGPKAVLLLDGRPIGNDGEIENESIPIGNHTLAIANDAGLVASRSQEYLEGQRLVFVYDLAKLNLRTMSEPDRELLAQRKAMEAVHRFDLEHDHGMLRGNCHGVLLLDYFDVTYKPSSGWHGFRIPFKLLRLSRAEGKTIDLSYAFDNKHFQTFKFPDEQTAEKFKQVWGELKAIVR